MAQRDPSVADQFSRARAIFDPLDHSRALGNLELRAKLEALAYDEAELRDRALTDGALDFAQHLLAERRAALQAELVRRERLYAAGLAVPNPRTPDPAWDALIVTIRARADVPTLLGSFGCEPHRTGRNGPRGTDEYHGPCPVCGGTDRFISWPPGTSPSRGYCRRCGVSFDAFALVQNYQPGCETFTAAVAFLATELGLTLPVPLSRPTQPPRLRVAETFEYRAGKVVAS